MGILEVKSNRFVTVIIPYSRWNYGINSWYVVTRAHPPSGMKFICTYPKPSALALLLRLSYFDAEIFEKSDFWLQSGTVGSVNGRYYPTHVMGGCN